MSIEDLYENFGHNLSMARNNITWCEFRYPELTQYTRQWRYISNDLTINCSAKKKSIGASFNTSKLRSIFSGWNGEINFNVNDSAIKALTSKHHDSSNKAIYTIVHEIFHGTAANNHSISKHNKVFYENAKCSDSTQADTDRVFFLASLCNESSLFVNSMDSIYQGIKNCGINYCKDLFKSWNFLDSFLSRSSGLSEGDSSKLCKKLYLKSACKQIISSKLNNDQFNNILDVKRFRKDLRNLLKILPKNDVPMEYIKGVPGINSGYLALRNSICFKQRLKVENGKLVCKIPGQSVLGCDTEITGKCTELTRRSLRKFLAQLEPYYEVSELDKFANGKSMIDYDTLIDFLNDSNISTLIGHEKKLSYIEMLSLFHPNSLDRDCNQLDKNELIQLIKIYDDIPKELKINHPECK